MYATGVLLFAPAYIVAPVWLPQYQTAAHDWPVFGSRWLSRRRVQPLARTAATADVSSIGSGRDPSIAQDVNRAAERPSGRRRKFLPVRGCIDRLSGSGPVERPCIDRSTADHLRDTFQRDAQAMSPELEGFRQREG
jgi:hypothetical protein